MDWKGTLVEITGYFMASLYLINGSFTKGGELGLIRLENFLNSFFSSDITFLSSIGNNTMYTTYVLIIGLLLIFKGKTLVQWFRKIIFRG